jgi:hypothetical protein
LTQKEIEEGIEELDKRVERLRAMYDQYFLGIERLEPSIQRRDVERRFSGLRREKIRNTAVRFRFNMLIQRFTTYQTFWQRVARQIEEGTYRRDVMKVRQRLELQRHARKQDRLKRMGELYEEVEGIDVDVDVEVDMDDEAAAPEPSAAPLQVAPPSVAPARPRVEVHELADEVRALTKAIEESEDPAESSVLTFGAVKRPLLEELEPDPRETTAVGLGPAPPGAGGKAAALGRITLRRLALTPSPPESAVIGVREESVSGVREDALIERITPPRGTGAAPDVPAPAPKKAAMPLAPARPGAPPASPGGPARPAPPAPARPVAKGAAPAAPSTPAPPPPRPAVAATPPPTSTKPAAADSELRALFLKRQRPSNVPGAAPPAPAAPAAPPPRAAAPRTDEGLPEARVRAIYDQYRATRRQNNEGDVAFESVRKSIGEMLPKLRQKAPGRELDFEVVVKDGKTVLKPVAK